MAFLMFKSMNDSRIKICHMQVKPDWRKNVPFEKQWCIFSLVYNCLPKMSRQKQETPHKHQPEK